MELPHVGKQCNEVTCKKLDFLPITCDACKNTFCESHYTYNSHNCPNAYLKNNLVPVCPLCNIPIPVARGQQPDLAVGAHIDNDCQSDPAKSHRKIFVNKCNRKGCKAKEVIPVICNDCKTNFCLKHRHPTDHNCQGKPKRESSFQNGAVLRDYSKIQGNMSEDEALARALAMSSQESGRNSSKKGLTQEELDLALARQMQAESTTAATSSNGSSRCNVQ